MRRLTIILCALALVACGKDSQMQQLVRQNLNDPDSAKFREPIISQDGNRACIEWNAKNAMGGYGEWKITEFKKSDPDRWAISEFKGFAGNCGEADFRALDDVVVAKREAFRKAKEILLKSRNLSDSAAGESLFHGECKDLYFKYAFMAETNARWKNMPDIPQTMINLERGFSDSACKEPA